MTDSGLFHLLSKLDDGGVVDEFSDCLQDLLAAVRRTHKKGKVTLTVSVKPNKAKGADVYQVSVQGDVTAKIPPLDHGGTLYYLDDTNRLSSRNPRQPTANTVQMPPPEERADLDGKSQAAGEKA